MNVKDGAYIIQATWDDEAKVWVAESDDVPGLATEAASMETLLAKLKLLIPELLELNGCKPSGKKSIEVIVRYQGEGRLSLAA